ncbi:MAG: porphobilinogen synthase [Verrucomicrobia bacterium]|nr:porphobilinogen synthase [Verrucomicrobiota bacterium]
MLKRPRRNRKTEAVRSLCQETYLSPQDLIMPFFVVPGEGRKEPIPSLPGVFKYSKDELVKQAALLHEKGVSSVLLFPAEARKDLQGSFALSPEEAVPKAISFIKKEIPSLNVLCDVALDPFTSHGHDGVVDSNGYVLNDETVAILQKMSLLYAQMGADCIAPSDMMDGRVGAIRRALDEKKHTEVSILSYTAKYASSLYGPFREALGSELQFGDKKNYQMDPRNVREALKEMALDEEEGADILMVKPALFYLDVIAKMKMATHLPICAYHVSGEYSMVMAAAEKGYLNADKTFLEALISIKRAGANCMVSYAVPRILSML